MTNTGIIRRIDDLGRVVIPREVRTRLHIKEGDPLELYLDGDHIVCKKYVATKNAAQVVRNAITYVDDDDELPPVIKVTVQNKLEEIERLLKGERGVE